MEISPWPMFYTVFVTTFGRESTIFMECLEQSVAYPLCSVCGEVAGISKFNLTRWVRNFCDFEVCHIVSEGIERSNVVGKGQPACRLSQRPKGAP